MYIHVKEGIMIKEVFQVGFNVLKKVEETQSKQIEQAAYMIAECFLQHKTFYVTGSGHSHGICEELYARAGGLAFVVPILTSELTMMEHPTKSSYLERLHGYADILVELYGVTQGDVVLIASNSGRNAYPIEMALEVKKRGAHVIAITNIAHSKAVTSRHASGKKLMDIADIVIDTCGVNGDSALHIEGLKTAVCPTSSMSNTFIAQAISVQCAQYIVKAGITPPVFVSLNSEGTKHLNDDYFEKYTRMYKKARL